jgi:uncharacterized membrane protein
LVGALFRFFQLGRESLWFDESLSVLFASQPLSISIGSMLQEGLQHSPLFYLLLRPFVSGTPFEFSARSLPAIAGVMAIPIVAILGKELFSPRTGIIAASLLALNPFHVWYSREARMYSLLALAVIGTMYFFALIVFRERKLRYWLGMSFFSAIGFSTHHFAFFMPLVQLVFILVTFKRSYLLLRTWAASMVLAALTLVPWIMIVLDSGVYWATSGTPDQTARLIDIPLTLWNFSIGYTRNLTLPIVLALLLFLAFIVNGLYPPKRSKLLLVIWLFVPLITTFLISLRFPMYVDRYLIVALPAFLLGFAEGMSSIRLPSLRRFAIAAAFLCTLLSLARIYIDRTIYERADWRRLGSFLELNADPLHDSIATVYYQDLISLHFYYHGSIPIHPIISNKDVNLPDVTQSEKSPAEGDFWLIIPHPNCTNHLVGHCQSFESEPFTTRADVISWRDNWATNLISVHQFTCIRLERYAR